MEAGNNLEQSVALVAAANKVVQDPNSVGSALRTISLRLRGTSVSVLEEMGEETEGVVTSVSKLQGKIKALTGVDILTESGAYKETYEILREIGTVWEDMSDIDQAALLELMAGKNRANTLAAILGNMEDLEGAYISALNAEGSALKENETYLDSIQGRIDLFNNSLQTMWMNFLDTDAVNMFVDLGTALVKFMDQFGLLPTLAGTLLPLKTVFKDIKASWEGINADNAFQIFGKGAKAAASDVDNLSVAIKASTDAKNDNTDATLSNIGATEGATSADAKESAGNIQNTVTQKAETNATNENTIATRANIAVTKALKAAKSMAKGLLIGLAITAVTSAISALISRAKEAAERMNELTESAINSANELNDARGELENHKEEIQKLRDTLADNTITEQEAYDARERLIEIQDSLVDSYGKEAENINLVTGAIDNQIDKLDELSRKKAAAWFTETDENGNSNQKAYDNAKKVVNETHDIHSELLLSTLKEFYNETYDSSTGEYTKNVYASTRIGDTSQLTQDQWESFYSGFLNVAKQYGGVKNEVVTDMNYADHPTKTTQYYVDFEGKTVDELEEIKFALATYVDEFGYNNGVDLSGIVAEISESIGQYNTEEYKNAVELYNLGRQNRAISTYADEYGTILDSEGVYYKAKTDKERLDAINTYKSEVDDAINAANLANDQAMVDYFTELRNKFNQEEYILKIKTDENGLKEELQGIISEAGDTGLSSLDDNQMKDLAAKYASGQFYQSPTGDGWVGQAGSGYTNEQIAGIAALSAQAAEAGMTVDGLIDALVSLGLIAGRPVDVSNSINAIGESYSELSSTVEKYANVSAILNESIYDNVKLSEDQYNALKELIGSEEEYADCIDESNGYIVKNSALLRKLVAQKKQEQKATINGVKAYNQLQYKNTVQQLQQVIKAMALEVKATGVVSDATLNTIDVLRTQLTTLKQTIQQYSLLELQLSNAANAYSEFEAAKERDAQLTYGDSMIEMLQTINEGFKTGQVGTEAFQFAVEALVPPEVYQNIDDVESRMIAIHDYIDKNPLFADWFTIDDNGFSITLDNINNFIDDAFNAGLFTEDSSGDFFLTDKATSLETFATELGVTEAVALAMLTELEKYDASWGNIISDLTTTGLDKEIVNATDALDDALSAQEEFIRSGGDLNSDEYKALVDNVNAAEKALDDATKAAELNAKQYNQIETIYAALSGKIVLTKDAADSLFRSLGFVDSNGDVTVQVDDDGTIQITEEQLLQLKEIADGITSEPTTFDMQLRYDTIDSQIAELQKYIDESLNFEDSEIAVSLGVTNEEEAKAKIEELTAEQKTISLNYNITATTAEQSTGTLEKLTTWETNGLSINISGDTEQLQQAVQDANALTVDDKEPEIIIQGVPVAISEIDSVYDELEKIKDKTVTISVNETTYQQTKKWNSSTQSWESDANGTAHAYGTANASGDWGATKTEVALTGELGPEMIVRGNRWFTVGDHGAEFTQVKKGDIIFNHKQTEDLLSKGYVTSRGKMAGGAFASGTAYYKTFDAYVGDNDVFENGSSEWVDPYTNTSSSLNNAADALSDAADNLSDSTDEFKEVFDWIEVRVEELDETLSLLGAQLENATYYNDKNNIIDSMIDVNKSKIDNLVAGIAEYDEYAAKLLEKVPEQYREAAQNGAIAITAFTDEADQATIEAINNYRDIAQKGADLKQQLEEIQTEIRDLAIQKFDNAYEAGSVRATVEDSQTEKIQNQIDLLEEMGEIASSVYYGINGGDAASSTGMFENSYKKIEYLTEARNAMQKELNEAVEKGQIIKGSNEWYELIDQMYQIDAEIHEANMELEEFQNAINDIYWDNFDQLIGRLDYLKDETQSLIDLMDSDDLVADPEKRKYDGGTIEYWTADDVKWTDEGIASLGLYAQQMEIAEYTARQYAEAIDDLEKDYAAGLYSENEYIEKLNELKESQYENIEAYYEAQDAIVDLNKTRVDSIKNGIEKEIDAYEELIEKKKEELDAEKDLYDFQKSTTEQQKNIAEIERKLAALANDNSMSATAKRKQLEAELAEAQYELQDTYYNRSVEDKQTALDKELEDFQIEKDAELAKWDEYLTNVELVVADSLNIVQANALGVYDTLNAKAQEYDLTLSDAIMTPWQDGALAVSDYQDTFDTSMSSTMNQLELLKQSWQDVIDKMTEAAEIDMRNITKENTNYTAAEEKKPEPTPEPPAPETPKEKEITIGGMIDATGAKIYDYAGDTSGEGQYFGNDPIYKVLDEKNGYLLVRYHKQSSGATGWFKKSDVKAYAKGTTKLKNSGIVNIDELGEELVLRAQNGRLTYMEKGSGVIPADLTSNLMEWGKLDPSNMLEQNRPSMNVHPEIHNTEVNLSMTYGDILHIEEFKGDNPEDIAKLVAKQFEKHTKDLNNALRKFVR